MQPAYSSTCFTIKNLSRPTVAPIQLLRNPSLTKRPRQKQGVVTEELLFLFAQQLKTSSSKDALLRCCPKLTFTFEFSEKNVPQYLNLCLSLENSHSLFRESTLYAVLPVFSCHPKTLKRCLVFSLVTRAISKSCKHLVLGSLANVTHWLREAGYTDSLVSAASLSRASGIHCQKTDVSHEERKGPIAFFSFYMVQHNLKPLPLLEACE